MPGNAGWGGGRADAPEPSDPEQSDPGQSDPEQPERVATHGRRTSRRVPGRRKGGVAAGSARRPGPAATGHEPIEAHGGSLRPPGVKGCHGTGRPQSCWEYG